MYVFAVFYTNCVHAFWWYQILLSPIFLCIHIQVWFYFIFPYIFYTERVFTWDTITFVRFMHTGSELLTYKLHIALLADLFMNSLPGMILLHLAMLFYTLKVFFAWDTKNNSKKSFITTIIDVLPVVASW